MKKSIFIFAAAMTFAISVCAVPAKQRKWQVWQSDGTTLTVTVKGDENFHFTCTTDGMPLVKNNDGSYCYAVLDNDNRLIASSQIAHDANGRDSKELSFLSSYAKQATAIRSLGKRKAMERNAARMERLEKRGTVDAKGRPNILKKDMAGPWGGDGIGVTGKRKGLVILVNFKDKKMQAKHTQEEWKNYFNEEGYSKMSNSGSVHDYFKAQSYGLFGLT